MDETSFNLRTTCNRKWIIKNKPSTKPQQNKSENITLVDACNNTCMEGIMFIKSSMTSTEFIYLMETMRVRMKQKYKK